LKYLVAGLGNIGNEYQDTRHNIGFNILDALAGASGFTFTDGRHGSIAEYRYKGCMFLMLKPSTYVNLSGKAVNYWLQKESIELSNLLVIADDIALPFGTIRLRPRGGDGGHNGLASIIQILATQEFARLRFGIGGDFPYGMQVDYVLGKWSRDEFLQLPDKIAVCHEIIRSFGTTGIDKTMNAYNNR
jgi:PTH1 family peptidyl-tRNA hydrolase